MSTLCIPQEIIDVILGELRDDIPTLRTCARVARSFLVTIRAHLFRVITLSRSSNCERLYHVLEGDHGLVSYIQELRVYNDRRDHWIEYNKCFACLLQLLAEIGSVRVFAVEVGAGRLWHEFPLRLREPFLALLRAPSIITVSLVGSFTSPFPVEVFAAAPRLKHLTLSGGVLPVLHQVDDHLLATTVEPGQLESLTLGDMSAEQLVRFLAAPRSPSRVSRLRELSITNVMPEAFGCIQRVLYAAQGTLTSFACNYRGDEISPTMIFDLRTLLQVRFLRFEVLLDRLNEDTFITALLNKSNLPPNLVRLTLSFDDEDYYFGTERFEHDAGDFQRVDSIIVSSIPTTCYIDIQMKVLIFTRVSGEQEAVLRSKALELFPSLHATGKFTLTLDIVFKHY